MKSIFKNKKKISVAVIAAIILIAAVLVLVWNIISTDKNDVNVKTKCMHNIEKLDRYIEQEREMETFTVMNNAIFAKISKTAFSGVNTLAGGVSGICPGGGFYTYIKDEKNDVYKANCTEHGSNAQFIDDAVKALMANDEVAEFIAERYSKGLDTCFINDFSADVTKKLSELLNMNLDNYSWRIQMENDGSYTVIWVCNDVSGMKVGTKVYAVMYNSQTDTYKKGETVIVKLNVNGSEYVTVSGKDSDFEEIK